MDLQLDLNSGKLDLTWFNHQNLGVGFIKTIGVRGVGFVRQQNLMLSLRQQPAQHRCVSSSFSCQQGQIPWRIHGAGIYIYTNINGVYWWDPCYHIYIYISIYRAAPWIRHGNDYFMIRPWMTFYLLETSEGNQLPVLVRWRSFAPILLNLSMAHHWRWWGPLLP